MYYSGIKRTSFVDGEGARTVLWVSGCNHKCPECQNKWSWDPKFGQEFDAGALVKLFDAVDREVIDGLTISGGDPMFPSNRKSVTALCSMFRTKFGWSKSIWMYTGYEFNEISDEPVLKMVDVVVDGPFIKELADSTYLWAGSTNQKIWRRDRETGMWTCERSSQNAEH